MHRLLPVLASLAFVASLPHVTADDPATSYVLRYDFRNQPSLHYRVVQNARIVTRKGEIRDETATAEETDKHFRVINVDKQGNALLESRIDRTRMAVRFDDATPVRYDSDSKEEPPKQFRDVRDRVGRPLARLKVSPRGELLTLARIGGKPGRDKKIDAGDNVLVEFPERALRIGDTWKQEFEIDVFVTRTVTRPARMLRTFTLEKVENGIATIGYRIAVVTPVVDPTISIQLIQRTPTGRISFDVERGRLVSRTQSVDERIFGPFGAGSWMHARSERIEKFIAPKKPEKAVAKAE